MKKEFFIAGARYYDLPKVIGAIKEGDILALEPEPENKSDPNAVKIKLGEKFLGYVPKKFSSEIAGCLEVEIPIECMVDSVNPKAKPWEMCKVVIRDFASDPSIEENNE